jgi:hypothetical protein
VKGRHSSAAQNPARVTTGIRWELPIGAVATLTIAGICAASVLVGCIAAGVAVTAAAIIVTSTSSAGIRGKNPAEAYVDALHDPFQWLNSFFGGISGGYFTL